ncbi:MAG: bifunctional diaminohydroxyphosphoribosylaminopyrimidine deaminase/5-amino-6-(5-phosphoribosylamino)uracil reductase RibD [Candidatus Micrarchaeia archaeon]
MRFNSNTVEDEFFMRIALGLANLGIPRAFPNPLVGAVVVKNGKIIATGYHREYGKEHAEIMALRRAGKSANGATLYVNLEPCCHYGKTGPCVDEIVKYGIKRVVVGIKDPNPKVCGGGIKKLREAGIRVDVGVLKNDAARLNEVFIKYMSTGCPFIALKCAMTLDGKIATETGDSKWISGKTARMYAHFLRAYYDAVLVGVNTVIKDDPLLTCRIEGGRNPVRVIVDSKLRIPLNAKVVREGTIIATSKKHDRDKREKLEKAGCVVVVCGKERVRLRRLVSLLGKRGITSLLVEGGGEVNASFINERIVDKIYFVIAPKIVGGKEAKTPVEGEGVAKMYDALKFKVVRVLSLGGDYLIEAYPMYKSVG